MNDPDQVIKCRNIYIYYRQYPAVAFDFWSKELRHDDEIAYWRKCWNIRNDILAILGGSGGIETYEYKVSYDNLLEIIKILKSYNRYNWDEGETQGLWEWRDIKAKLRKQIKTFKRVAAIMRENPNAFTLIFYDSY